MNEMWRNPYLNQSFSHWPDMGLYPAFGYGGWQIYAQQIDGNQQPAWAEPPVTFFMPRREEDWQAEQDAEYFQQMWPSQARSMQAYTERVCDNFDYDGSLIYDEYPDRVSMMRLRNMILQEAAEDETLFGESGCFPTPDCTPAKDMVDLLLFQEVHKRRCRKRNSSPFSDGRF